MHTDEPDVRPRRFPISYRTFVPSTPRARRSRVRFCNHINASSRWVSAIAFSRHANLPLARPAPSALDFRVL